MNAVLHPLLTIEDYLAAERVNAVRHEYAGGQVFAMTGASKRHNRICLNAAMELRAARQPCDIHMADVLVRIEQVFYYPDVMVVCEPNDHPYVETNPCLIIEVLSDSTEGIDRREKLQNYQRIPHLQAYLLIAQSERRVEVFRRSGGLWAREVHSASGMIALDCPQTMLGLDRVYEGTGVPCLS